MDTGMLVGWNSHAHSRRNAGGAKQRGYWAWLPAEIRKDERLNSPAHKYTSIRAQGLPSIQKAKRTEA